MKHLIYLFILLGFGLPTQTLHAEDSPAKPGLLLANQYHKNIDVRQYWISEKLDGVRALWTGSKLLSRNGTMFNAPEWFVAGFPQRKLDGELWMGRQTFDQASGIVRKKSADDANWRQIKYMVFDLPDDDGNFTQRLHALEALITELDIDWLKAVRQWKVDNHDDLTRQLEAFSEAGAEGLMLHRADSYYHPHRSDDLLKLKRHQDAEAKVIKHLPGKGAFSGMMGSILVETKHGRRFKIGTGFTHEQRLNPPKPGSIITYQYNGFTINGLPRFARFLRVKTEH